MTGKKDKLTRFKEWYSNHPVVSILIVIALIIISADAFTGSIFGLVDRWNRIWGTQIEVVSRPEVVIRDYIPKSFDTNDPRLLGIYRFQLRKQVGESVQVGRCPNEECLTIMIKSIDILHDPPSVMFSIGMVSGGSRFDAASGLGFALALRKGCFEVIRTSINDFYIELVDDRVEHITAVVGFFPGSQPKGVVYGDTAGCP